MGSQVKLRPYQGNMTVEARDKMIAGCKSILMQSPTGSGKTVLIAHMLHTAAAKGKRCWFLVHRRELIKQSVRTFVEVNVPHGVIANGFGVDPSQLVQIASVQTLARRYHKIIPPDLIIWDECHHVAAGSWDKIYRSFPNSYHIGLTATPERLDGKGLRPWFKEMIRGPEVRWLIENGFLSDYKIFAPTQIDTEGLKMTGGDFNKKALNNMLADKPQIVGDAVREYQRYANGKAAVAFCASVQASKNLVAQFNAAGIRAAHVDAETDRDIRDLEIKRFKRGELSILSNVDLFGEGFDVPGIEAIIMLRPTNSMGLYLQQVGRALRPAPGKDFAIILDHAGNVQRHGLPDEVRQWSLDGKGARRQAESDGPGVKICERCYAAQKSGPPKCLYCGFEFEINHRQIDHVEGELHEMALPPRQTHKQRVDEQQQAHTEEELYKIGKDRGLKHARRWSKHVHQAQQRAKLLRGKG